MEVIVADTLPIMRKVWGLTGKVYYERGYARAGDRLELRHYPLLDLIDQTTVFLFEDSKGSVGTISVTEDGPCGLHVDKAFPKAVATVRNTCSTRLGASWRIVTRSDMRMYRQVLFSLIDVAIQEMIKRKLDTTLYSFHPQHEDVHRKLLGFETIDRISHDSTVGGAPAVLMRGDLRTMIRYWSKRYGR